MNFTTAFTTLLQQRLDMYLQKIPEIHMRVFNVYEYTYMHF